MFLRRLCVKNYKSLKNVEFCPTNLSVLVGPNGAGKSNFASAVDFLSDAYRDGLETAVGRKGGYDNIAYRGQARCRSAIAFEVTIEAAPFESLILAQLHKMPEAMAEERAAFLLTHRFSIKPGKRDLGGDFRVCDERFEVHVRRDPNTPVEEHAKEAELVRSPEGRIRMSVAKQREQLDELVASEVEIVNRARHALGDQQLFASIASLGYVESFSREVASWRVFHIVPSDARDPGVQTPNPALSITGRNLPALVDWLKKHREKYWFDVLMTMQEVLPELEDIESSYLHTKTLGLFFKETTSSKPWPAEDVSDGTIHALSQLVALADPRNTTLMIEEVENAFHPWIVQSLMKRFRFASQEKTIILTTHSPVVVDTLDPSETWVVFKKAGQTRLKNLGSIDRKLRSAWERGEFRLSDYLDSGLLPQAIPGGDL